METKQTERKRLDAGRTREEYRAWMRANNLVVAQREVEAALALVVARPDSAKAMAALARAQTALKAVRP